MNAFRSLRKFTPSFSTKSVGHIEKIVYFSKSTDIFTNLAIEDWLYNNYDFEGRHLLMLWRNEPCVVIGRHQNPWTECNFAQLANVKLARRNSGGGTVYHDLGNLNMTFFTPRKSYDRKMNLQMICQALNKAFELQVSISPREDLVIGEFKISGTASKLGRTVAYHHCTLLVDVNKDQLRKALKNDLVNVESNATRSVKSKIMNLTEQNPNISVDDVKEVIAREYLGGAAKVNVVDGDEMTFPGLEDIKKRFSSMEWRFLKTPKFKISRSVSSNPNRLLNLVMLVENGVVSKVYFVPDASDDLDDVLYGFGDLQGRDFSKELLDQFEMLVDGVKNSYKVMTWHC